MIVGFTTALVLNHESWMQDLNCPGWDSSDCIS